MKKLGTVVKTVTTDCGLEIIVKPDRFVDIRKLIRQYLRLVYNGS